RLQRIPRKPRAGERVAAPANGATGPRAPLRRATQSGVRGSKLGLSRPECASRRNLKAHDGNQKRAEELRSRRKAVAAVRRNQRGWKELTACNVPREKFG